MEKPIVPWDADESFIHPKIVWFAQLDNRFWIEVRRIDSLSATLYIFDHDNNDKFLHSFSVGLMYGAKFGPDVSDVNKWQNQAADYVDDNVLSNK